MQETSLIDHATVNLNTGELVNPDDPVEKGREAWTRIKNNGKKLREDWLITAVALNVGRKKLENEKNYAQKFGKWCNENGFSDMHFTLRSDALWMLDNWESITNKYRLDQLTFNGPKNLRNQYRQLEKKRKKEEKAQRKNTLVEIDVPPRLIVGDFREVEIEKGSIDYIITDPPYPRKYLNLYEDLSRKSKDWLRPGGLLIVMSGQSWFIDVANLLATNMDYLWLCAYLTPGGQSAQIFNRKVNTFWKPLIILSNGEYSGDWFGDVFESAVNDNDKNHHHWGQSESGLEDIIGKFTYPGDHVLDPFLGGGTTGYVCTQMGRRFTGIDINADCIERTKNRIG